MYYPLHVHTTTGSIGDSILKVPDYIAKAQEYGLDALAITDHGSLAAMYEFYDACMTAGIKPIIGMEAYVTDDNSLKDKEHKNGSNFHLVLLAKNQEGFKNLMRIHNNAQIEGIYYKPRTDIAHLRQWGEGIIALSACVGGEIPQALLKEDIDTAVNLTMAYKEIFDEFYLEIQPGSFEEQLTVNQGLVQLAEATDTPLIITNDIHYLVKDDAVRHNFHVKLGYHSKKIDSVMAYPDNCYWFMDEEALKSHTLTDDIVTAEVVEEAIKNAAKVAASCNVEIDDSLHMPQYVGLPEGVTEEEMLYRECYSRLQAIIEDKPNPQDYVSRLEYELKVIKDKGFCGYFLIVADYVKYAREHNIPVGPGRGSAAGSLVTYLMGICAADPIQYGLLFERFLDPHREAIPDVDIDFSSNDRDKMFEYMVDHYGYEHCAMVSTLGIRKAKSAIHDAARILGYDNTVGNTIAKLIPMVYYGDDGTQTKDLDIETSLEVVPELRQQQEAYPDVLELAINLEGLPSTKGIHAAGVLVTPVDFTRDMPLVRPNKEGIMASALTLDDAEKQAVKFDFLALSHLDLLRDIETRIGWKFDFRDESLLHDEATWDLIGSRETTGVFQIGSKTYKDRLPRLRPRSIDELAACLALVRGPSISAKTDETYMRIIEGKEEVKLIHPLYDEITKNTNGIMIYQEQIMHLAVAFGMDLTTGYRLIKLAAKKKIKKLEAYREQFIPLAKERDCDEETANKIFDMIVDAGLYSFNKSHAVSYGLITYAGAYLKAHYPLEFARALLSYTWIRGKDKEYNAVYDECVRMGVKFLPADIRKSNREFTIEDGKIRVGLCAIKGLGDTAIDIILKHREDAYDTVSEFVECLDKEAKETTGFNKKAVSVAVFSGLFDSLLVADDTRRDLFQEYLDWRGGKEKIMPDKITLSNKQSISPEDDYGTLEEAFFCENFIFNEINDIESFGWKEMKAGAKFEDAPGIIQRVKKIKTRTGEQMAFVTIGTGDGMIEATVFAATLKEYGKLLRKNTHVLFAGTKERNGGCLLREVRKE